jgi:hypothetical protein
VDGINGKRYRMAENSMNIKEMRFDFNDESGVMKYENARGLREIPFGIGWNMPGIFPETHYSGTRIGRPRNAGYEMHVSAAWKDGNTLGLRCHITDDYLGSLNMNATFIDKYLTVNMVKYAEDFLHDYHGFASGEMIDESSASEPSTSSSPASGA